MECSIVSVFSMENSYLIENIVIIHRSIIVTWLIVTISAIPVGISHGIEEYYNHKNEINTACQFLEGYNHAAFQVSRQMEGKKTDLCLNNQHDIHTIIRIEPFLC